MKCAVTWEELASDLSDDGCGEESMQEIICTRFGDPDEIGRAFSETYRAERIAINSIHWAVLSVASFVAVAIVISSIQALAGLQAGVR